MMAKRISNRIARRTLGMTHWHSNTRIMTRSGALVQVHASRRQARRNIRECEILNAWTGLIESAREGK
ncbi:hypothetical protein C7M51_01611 [Mixta intestinalis]|uniref:Uncharacterized protein n=1 Tax=Mixta intestinalis TaxID=1615494 RepID=A0A6P1Q0G2_9GAMM|nr:hypothetical protein C7M51_01611 [Mixta intestinalis]